MIIYRAENINTGEVYEGDSNKLAEFLGTKPRNINKYAYEKIKLYGVWLFTILPQQQEPEEESKKYRMTDEIWEQWDKITAPFKALSREKAKNKGKKEE